MHVPCGRTPTPLSPTYCDFLARLSSVNPNNANIFLANTQSPASKMYRPTSVWAWAFLATAGFQALFAIVVDSFLLYKFDRRLFSIQMEDNSDTKSSKEEAMRLTPTYLVVLVLGLLFHASLSWDTLRLQNTVQICGVCAFGAALSAYALAEAIQVLNTVSNFRLQVPGSGPLLTASESRLLVAIPTVLAITTLGLCFVAWKLSHLFAWTIYKNFSADVDVRKRYTLLEVSDLEALSCLIGRDSKETDYCRCSSMSHC